jgi:FkbM family methyltransferase
MTINTLYKNLYLSIPSLKILAKKGKLASLIGVLFDNLFGYDINIKMHKIIHNSDCILVDVLDFKMYVNISDSGLSQTLFNYGIREQRATHEYIKCLDILEKESHQSLNILEIGANIGYYALIGAKTVDKCQVLAVEPESKNIGMLEKNINANNFGNKINIHQYAVGNSNKTVELNISDRGNRHSLKNTKEHSGSELVEMKTPEKLLSDIGQDQIDVLRMDIEGAEIQVFKSLSAERLQQISLIFLELHPTLMEEGDINEIIYLLKESDFRIQAVFEDTYGDSLNRGWHEEELSINSFEILGDYVGRTNKAIELILIKELPLD